MALGKRKRRQASQKIEATAPARVEGRAARGWLESAFFMGVSRPMHLLTKNLQPTDAGRLLLPKMTISTGILPLMLRKDEMEAMGGFSGLKVRVLDAAGLQHAMYLETLNSSCQLVGPQCREFINKNLIQRGARRRSNILVSVWAFPRPRLRVQRPNNVFEWVRGPTLGRGSFATVSLASWVASGEVFAVKSANLSRSSSLKREQTILSALQDCPSCIISCLGYEVDVSHDTYNLFLEYASGGSLSDNIKHNGGACLDESAIQSLAREILTGLSYLHRCGIVHCDIKSDNILVGSDGRTMIADLGCARWMADWSTDRQIRGSPMYMAPEVARGEEQGPAADVWALGCTIIEVATGRPAWPGVISDPLAILHRVGFSDDTPELPRWVSDECKDFLDKCLKRDPDERWSADQLLEHSFVACTTPKPPCWDSASPNSTLQDLGLWETCMVIDEVEEQDHPSIAPSQRIHQLVGTRPDWTWDDDWLPVRISNPFGVRSAASGGR